MTELKILQNKEALEELRKRMKDVLSTEMFEDDVLFYRFLKARDFDINKAEFMLRNHIAYRKAHQIDTIVQDFKPKEVFTKFFQGPHLGDSKEGYPVRYVCSGKLESRDVLKCFKNDNYFHHWRWIVETDFARLQEINIKNNTNICRFIYIIDLDQLQMSNAFHPVSVAQVITVAEEYQDNYPETLQSAYIINAPAFFVYIFSIVKKILAAEVLKKIHIFGRTGWKEELLKVIDADVLPAFLGGTRTNLEGYPTRETFICHGGRIPSTYYLSKEDRTFKDKTHVKHVAIFPGTSHEVYIDVEEYGSVIQWEFEVNYKDIGFSLYFKDSEHNLREILPPYRFETPDGTYTSSLKCQWIGKYVIIFENIYSRFYTKEVSYCISVIKPGQISS